MYGYEWVYIRKVGTEANEFQLTEIDNDLGLIAWDRLANEF